MPSRELLAGERNGLGLVVALRYAGVDKEKPLGGRSAERLLWVGDTGATHNPTPRTDCVDVPALTRVQPGSGPTQGELGTCSGDATGAIWTVGTRVGEAGEWRVAGCCVTTNAGSV